MLWFWSTSGYVQICRRPNDSKRLHHTSSQFCVFINCLEQMMTRCRLYWCGGKQLTSHVSRMFASSQFTDVNLFPSNALCVNSDLKKTKFWGNLAFFIHFFTAIFFKMLHGHTAPGNDHGRRRTSIRIFFSYNSENASKNQRLVALKSDKSR